MMVELEKIVTEQGVTYTIYDNGAGVIMRGMYNGMKVHPDKTFPGVEWARAAAKKEAF